MQIIPKTMKYFPCFRCTKNCATSSNQQNKLMGVKHNTESYFIQGWYSLTSLGN